MLYRTMTMALIVVGALPLASISTAQVTNGSFEAGGGSYTGWGTKGLTSIVDSTFGTNPTDGTYQALLSTVVTDPTGVPIFGASPNDLDSFLNIGSSDLANVGNGTPQHGSAISQSVMLHSGETLSFNWDFLTNQVLWDGTSLSVAPDVNNNDFSFLTVGFNASQVVVSKLADTFYGYAAAPNPAGFTTGFIGTSASSPYFSETGYQTYTYTAMATGTYSFGFGVVTAASGQENGVNSALLIDNVRVQSVPEPASMLALGTMGFAALRTRRSTRKGKA